MSQLLIAAMVIATFGVLLGGGMTYIDVASLRDAATARAIAAEHTRLSSGIAGYAAAHGTLPPMRGWPEAIVPYTSEPVAAMPAGLRWVYVARAEGFGLCVDHPGAGPRASVMLDPIDCADLPEIVAGGLVLAGPAVTRISADGSGAAADLTARQGYHLMNVAPWPVRIEALAFEDGTGLDVANGSECLAAPLGPDATCAFEVTFTTAGNGSLADQLRISARRLAMAGG